MDTLPARLSQIAPVEVAGVWQRHVPARYADAALEGRTGNGRWGRDGSYPVLYFGKPTESVVVEAYRHLIDPVAADGEPIPPVRPRALVTCEVSTTEILDLRSSANRILAGLTLGQLQSDTSDRSAYAACQNVSAAAHQLGFHGVVAPAATKMGETLALFTDVLTDAEELVLTATEMWVALPSDPRNPPRRGTLRVVR